MGGDVMGDTLFGYPIVYVDDSPKLKEGDIVLANWGSWWSSELHRKDWPKFYKQQCEEAAAAIRNLEAES